MTGDLTEEQVGRMFAGMNEIIRAGEEMRRLRAEMIQLFAAAGWTQDRLARLAGMSQPAVSKQVARAAAGAPGASGTGGAGGPADVSLDQLDTPWLEGRLWGLAEELSAALDDTAHCSRLVHALARGRKRFTPQNVDALRRLVEEDLREYGREAQFAPHRVTYDRIARGLDVLATTEGTEAGPASRRRALACQIQRVRLHET
ncbi:sigma-70 family RNA polymerase sigma factor [Streptomyces sp. NPDC127092]|uniref:sigma-70 family RNA polymerase sigma factor n=1 Tax=Streptomyces sp. NPDC127092 TaxID=3347135 RepID=UPI00366A0A1C